MKASTKKKPVPAYGDEPRNCGLVDTSIPEVMYYLYLPVFMRSIRSEIRLPPNLECCRQIIHQTIGYVPRQYEYIYISARKGWATPDNPLNRPGWHCDGFGTDDMNYVWWKGDGTRFAIQPFNGISNDHVKSLEQFEQQVNSVSIKTYPESTVYELHPKVVHATPLINPPGQMRQYVKVSFSDHKYNLENNSHNHLFEYEWPLMNREITRNDTHAAQKDYAK